MILDLVNPQKAYRKLLDEIAETVRGDFINLTAQLGMGLENNISWWITNLSTRNNKISQFFLNFCYLNLIDYLIKTQQQIKEIRVNNKGLQEVLINYIEDNRLPIKVIFKQGIFTKIKNIIRPGYNLGNSFLSEFFQFIWAKLFKPKYALDEEIIILDTFILSDSFDGYNFHDRYFGDLTDYLTYQEKSRLFYFPTFYQVKLCPSLYRKIRGAWPQFVLKEDFLKFSDYFFALTQSLKILTLGIHGSNYKGFDIQPLVKEEIYRDLFSHSTIEALLKFRFALRMKEKKVKIKLIINWFENQVIDHGANAGFRKYCPDTTIIGYQGFALPKNYLSLFATSQEKTSMVIPHQIAVMGKGYTDLIKDFCPDLKVQVAPAFRYKWLWEQNYERNVSDGFVILISLPITPTDGNDILELVDEASRECCTLKNYRYLVKPHPAVGLEKIKKHFGKKWPRQQFELVEGSFKNRLQEADLLISNSSSTCLETLACGVPVIIVGGRSGLTQNPIPDSAPADIWRLCYTAGDLARAVEYFAALKASGAVNFKTIGEKIRKAYFEPVTREAARKFLDLSSLV